MTAGRVVAREVYMYRQSAYSTISRTLPWLTLVSLRPSWVFSRLLSSHVREPARRVGVLFPVHAHRPDEVLHHPGPSGDDSETENEREETACVKLKVATRLGEASALVRRIATPQDLSYSRDWPKRSHRSRSFPLESPRAECARRQILLERLKLRIR